jgi:hypothetical protein
MEGWRKFACINGGPVTKCALNNITRLEYSGCDTTRSSLRIYTQFTKLYIYWSFFQCDFCDFSKYILPVVPHRVWVSAQTLQKKINCLKTNISEGSLKRNGRKWSNTSVMCVCMYGIRCMQLMHICPFL